MTDDAPDLWLVQYLCPRRHALCASPYDRHVTTAEAHEAALLAEMTRTGVEHRCGLCGSRDIHFEHRKLPYTDWDTALAVLAFAQVANIETRLAVDRTRGNKN